MSLYGQKKTKFRSLEVSTSITGLQPRFTKRTHSFLLPPRIRVGTIYQTGVTECYHDSRRHHGPRPKRGKRIRIEYYRLTTPLFVYSLVLCHGESEYEHYRLTIASCYRQYRDRRRPIYHYLFIVESFAQKGSMAISRLQQR
jgi:hypothetical protein